MPYVTVFTKSFQKEFRKLPKGIQETTIKTLEKTTANPYSGKKLSGKLDGFVAFVAILFIGAWIGYTMATTPPPKPIEEITTEQNIDNPPKPVQ